MKKFFIILKINIKKILLISFLLLISTFLFFPERLLKLEKVNKLVLSMGYKTNLNNAKIRECSDIAQKLKKTGIYS